MLGRVVRPPGPPRGFRNLAALMRDAPSFLLEAARHGDLVYIRIGVLGAYLVNHPDLVKEVLLVQNKAFTKGLALQGAKRLLGQGLLTNEGEDHKKQRKLLQPHFHHDRIAAYARTVTEHGVRWRDRWRAGQAVDVNGAMAGLTLGIIGKALFDVDLERENPELGQALNDALESFNRLALPVARQLDRLPLPQNRRFRASRAKLDAMILAMVQERRGAAGKDRGDMLSMLVNARHEDGGHGMTEAQIRDEAVTIFLAGHDTTSQALTYTWYLLSQNPAAEAALREELARVLGGRLPGLEDVPRLPYARACFAEAMRLHPPAWVLGRRAIQPCRVGGYDIPAGSIVLVSQLVAHRDPRFWPDPAAYRPERWLREDPGRPRLAYFPFGAGPRVCIGEPFAWMEAVLLIATLAQRWRLRLQPGYRLEYQPTLTLKPRHGMPMVPEPA